MSNAHHKKDHPGPEWVEERGSPDYCEGQFTHYGFAYWPEHISWGDGPGVSEEARGKWSDDNPRTRAEAIERCRQISASVLAWERSRACATLGCEPNENSPSDRCWRCGQ